MYLTTIFNILTEGNIFGIVSENELFLPQEGQDDEEVSKYSHNSEECHPQSHGVVPGIRNGVCNVELLPVGMDQIHYIQTETTIKICYSCNFISFKRSVTEEKFVF